VRSNLRNGVVGAAMVAIIAVFWTAFPRDNTDVNPPTSGQPSIALSPIHSEAQPKDDSPPTEQHSVTKLASGESAGPTRFSRATAPKEGTHDHIPGKAKAKPAKEPYKYRDTEPEPRLLPEPAPNRQLAEISPQPESLPLPANSWPAEPEPHVQFADMSSQQTTEPQCEPYVSNVDFAARERNVRGLACQDSSGAWWLVDQHTE